MQTTVSRHWTEKKIADFVYRISSDFVVRLEQKLEESGISHKALATTLGVSSGRVSQVLNNPGNLTLTSTVQYARALGMKVALIAYEDGDPQNSRGPINSEVFSACWKRCGQPQDFFALQETGWIHQLDPYPLTCDNVAHMHIYHGWPTRTAATRRTERVN